MPKLQRFNFRLFVTFTQAWNFLFWLRKRLTWGGGSKWAKMGSIGSTWDSMLRVIQHPSMWLLGKLKDSLLPAPFKTFSGSPRNGFIILIRAHLFYCDHWSCPVLFIFSNMIEIVSTEKSIFYIYLWFILSSELISFTHMTYHTACLCLSE